MSFIAAGIGAVGSIAGGIIGAGAASKASQQQAAEFQQAANFNQNAMQGVQNNEQPYINAGKGAQGQLNNLLGIGAPDPSQNQSAGGYGSLNSPFTAQTFQQYSPAYQFQLQQGGTGVLNQDSSSQGAESGAAMKDLVSFNQGLANTSFNNAFQQYQTQQNNTFNRLNSIATQGQSAGSNSTLGASQFGANVAGALGGVGNAKASGTIGAANAITGAINSATPWLASAVPDSTPGFTPTFDASLGAATGMGNSPINTGGMQAMSPDALSRWSTG